MSYDIYLTDPVTGDTLETKTPHDMHGGTYEVAVDPSDPSDRSKWRPSSKTLWLNMTYNYSNHLYKVFPSRPARDDDKGNIGDAEREVGGIDSINGMTGAESVPLFEDAISKLSDDVDPDYWKSTEGNTKTALCMLLEMAYMRPDGVWRVS